MAARKKTTARKSTRKTTTRKTARKKPAARKTTARRSTAKKSTAKRGAKKTVRKTAKRSTAKKVVKKSAPKLTTVKTPFTKSQLVTTLSEQTEVAKGDVKAILESFEDVINAHIKKGGAGTFSLPGLIKIQVVRKKATKARKGINPFTGEPTIFKAKPARNVVKVRPLKKLKEMVN